MSYGGEESKFTMTQILGMLLTKARQVVELNMPGLKDVEAVITVPVFFTDAQRRAVLDAAKIANIDVHRLLNEGTAAALSFGMFKGAKKEFPEGVETPYMFLDMGASTTTATIAIFTNSSVRVLSSVADPNLGGRDLDVAIAQNFAAEFKSKTGADAWKNRKARLKLMIAAEKSKIAISPHGVNSTPVSVECLMEDHDFNSTLTEDKLVEIVGERVKEKLTLLIQTCLQQSGKVPLDMASIELVGGSMRVRLVKRVAGAALGLPVNEATGHGLSQSMNLDETKARGAALASAMASTLFKSKDVVITDAVTFTVKAVFEGAGGPSPTDAMEEDVPEEAASIPATGGTIIFKTGGKIKSSGSIQKLRVDKQQGTFDFALSYDVPTELAFMFPAGTPTNLGKYAIGVPRDALGPNGTADVRVFIEMTRNGTIGVTRAEAMKEIEAPPAVEGDAMPMEIEAAKDSKKRFKAVDAVVTLTAGWAGRGLSEATLRAVAEAERKMVAQDDEIHATQDMRNSLEAYIYMARSAVDGDLVDFTSPAEREAAGTALTAMEEWLYGEGFEATKAVYAGKLAELKGLCEPVFARKWEFENRPAARSNLEDAIASFKAVLDNSTGMHGHLGDTDKDTLRSATSEAERWLRAKSDEQKMLEQYESPALKVADLNVARDRLVKELTPIQSRKAPVPITPMDVESTDMPGLQADGGASSSSAVPPPATDVPMA